MRHTINSQTAVIVHVMCKMNKDHIIPAFQWFPLHYESTIEVEGSFIIRFA